MFLNSNSRQAPGSPAQRQHVLKNLLRGMRRPQEPMPAQKPVTDEEEAPPKTPSRARKLLVRALLCLLLAAALVFAYLFLLLGEPDEDAKYAVSQPQAQITMPMSALETPGDADVQSLADTFGQPVLSLYGGLSMQKARIFDTAFEGGYARRVTLTYAFEDGATLTLESVRPTSAGELLDQRGYKLEAQTLYTLGGLNAARMDNSQQSCVFAQNDVAVYAVVCPASHAGDLPALLKTTTLTAPSYHE